MPGQRPTLAAEAAAIPHDVTPINIPAGVSTLYRPIFTAPKRMAIEEAVVRYRVANGAACTGTLVRAASGVAANGGAAVTVTESVNFNSTVDTNNTFTFVQVNGVPSTNIMEAGDTLFLVLTGTVSTALGPISGYIRTTDVLQ